MKCCLWLNGRKVYNAPDIKNNFDLISLRGYFIGGSLKRWLESNGGLKFVKKLKGFTDEKGFPLQYEMTNEILLYVFGFRKNKPSSVTVTNEPETKSDYTFKSAVTIPIGYLTSFPLSSFVLGSWLSFGSFPNITETEEWYNLKNFGSFGSFANFPGSFLNFYEFYEYLVRLKLVQFKYYGALGSFGSFGSFSLFGKRPGQKFKFYKKIRLLKNRTGSFTGSGSFRLHGSFIKFGKLKNSHGSFTEAESFISSFGSFKTTLTSFGVTRNFERQFIQWRKGFREENTPENNSRLTENLIETIEIYERDGREFCEAEVEIVLDLELFYEWNPLDRYGYGIFLI
jgi:hypothetical protein